MNHRRSTMWILICTLFAGIVIATGAPAVDAGQDDDRPYTEPLISVEFPGGTVAQYIAALEKSAGAINIVVPKDAADVPMPAFGLNNVTVSAAVDLLNTDVEGEGYLVVLEVEELHRRDPREQPIYRIQVDTHGKRTPQQMTNVWSAAELLATRFKSAEVLAAIETALDVSNLSNEAEVRFHEATGLIIARGVPEQLSIIDNVLEQLTVAQEYMPEEPPTP